MLRKNLGILLVLFSSWSTASGFKVITAPDGYEGIADEQGEIIIPAIYEKLGWSDGSQEIPGEAIGYFENDQWGLINLKSKKLTGAQYSILVPFDDQLFEAGITGKFSNQILRGIIDDRAKVYLDFKYFTIESIGGGKAITSEYSEGKLKYGLYSIENVQIINSEYANLYQLGNILVAKGNTGKSRILNVDGHSLLDFWVDSIEETSGGLLVQNDGYYGLLDLDGNYFHHVRYKEIDGENAVPFVQWEIRGLSNDDSMNFLCDSIRYDSNENLLIAHVNNVEHILAASDQVFKDQNQSLKYIGQGFLVTKNQLSEEWGIFKTDGREVAVGFDSVVVDTTFFYGYADSKWEIYNRFGRKINQKFYQRLGPSHNGFVPVKFADYWGWVDFQGEVVVKNKYDAVRAGLEDQYLAKNFGSWGIQRFYGDWLVMPRYDSIYIANGYYVGVKGRLSDLYDGKGVKKFSFPYQVIGKDLLYVKSDENKIGLITSQGQYIPPIYTEIQKHEDFFELNDGVYSRLIKMNGDEAFGLEKEVNDVISYSENYFHVIKDGKHGFVDDKGNLRIANRYDSAQYYNEGLAPVKLMGKWGFIGPYENLLIQPFYQYSSTFQNGLAIVQIDDLYGLLDKNGKEVIQIKWAKIDRLSTGNYLVKSSEGKVGIANEQGRFLLRPNYEAITDTAKQLLIVNRAGKVGIMDYSGLQQIPFEYSEIKIEGEYILLKK